MGCGLGSAPWRPVRPRGSESTPTAPAPAVREGRGVGGDGVEGRPHPGRARPPGAATGGGSRAVKSAAPAGGGCAPATACYWPRARLAGGAGARGGGGVGGGVVTAQGGFWARRGSARVRGCGSAGVSPGCVRVSGSEFVLGSAGSACVSPGEWWGCGPSWCARRPHACLCGVLSVYAAPEGGCSVYVWCTCVVSSVRVVCVCCLGVILWVCIACLCYSVWL